MTMLLSLMVMSVSSFTYQTEYNYQRSTFGTTSSYISHNNTQSIEYRRIGYTTNYSNGQFNSTQYYRGTYNHSQSSSGGRHGGPRRVVIKHGNDSIDTGREDDWDPSWKYGYGEFSILFLSGKRYYYTNEKGETRYWNGSKWVDVGFGDIIYSYEQAEAHPSVPIGDNYIWFMVCIVSIYSLIKANRNKLKRSAY